MPPLLKASVSFAVGLFGAPLALVMCGIPRASVKDSYLTNVHAGSISAKNIDGGPVLKFARSPLGPPPPNVEVDRLLKFADECTELEPLRILTVDVNCWLDIPVSVSDHKSRLFDITGFDMKTFSTSNLNCKKPRVPSADTWDLSRPQIRVSALSRGSPVEVGMVQYSQRSWDVMFHFRKPSTGGDLRRCYNSYLCRVGNDSICFDPRFPIFLWMSTLGPLLWTRRTTAKKTKYEKPQKNIVLLDAYDRMIAVEFKQHPGPRCWKDVVETNARQLRLYGDFSEQCVDQIITSYAALCGQMRRKSQLDLDSQE